MDGGWTVKSGNLQVVTEMKVDHEERGGKRPWVEQGGAVIASLASDGC